MHIFNITDVVSINWQLKYFILFFIEYYHIMITYYVIIIIL